MVMEVRKKGPKEEEEVAEWREQIERAIRKVDEGRIDSLRVGQASYLCHAAILASSSSLLHSALSDPQVDNLNEMVTVVLAGWTKEEAELYMKQTYNQVDLLLPEELVKVESVLSFRVRPQCASVNFYW